MLTVPPLIPVTTPVGLTDATDPLLVFQIPPAVASVRVIVLPVQTDDGPAIFCTLGCSLAVTVVLATSVPPPQVLFTVYRMVDEPTP